MPFKYNAACRHRIPRARYRVTNWPAYGAGLRHRGDLTLWLDEAALAGWAAPKRSSPGGQPLYSELAIELVLTLRLVFHREHAKSWGGRIRPPAASSAHSRSASKEPSPTMSAPHDFACSPCVAALFPCLPGSATRPGLTQEGAHGPHAQGSPPSCPFHTRPPWPPTKGSCCPSGRTRGDRGRERRSISGRRCYSGCSGERHVPARPARTQAAARGCRYSPCPAA